MYYACLAQCVALQESERAEATVVILMREYAFLFVWDIVCGRVYNIINVLAAVRSYGDTARAGLSPFTHVQLGSYVFLFALN